MLTCAELIALLAEPESERLEWKAAASDEQVFGKAVCALANDLGGSGRSGYLLYGKRDDGTASGADFGDEIQQIVSNWSRSGKLLPPPLVSTQQFSHDGCVYLLVRVHPSPVPPVSFASRIYIRVGPTTRHAQPHEENLLNERRRALAQTADQIPIAQASLDDLDIDFFNRDYLRQAVAAEVLQENQRPLDHQLKSLKIMSANGQPTYAGLLLLGYDPRRFIPGAYVQFLRLDGTTLTDAIRSQQEVSGPLPEMLRRLEELLAINITAPTIINSSGQHTEFPNYPKEALMHLVINALLHRTYEQSYSPVRLSWFNDRIEIQNPGGPYGQVTRQNFGTGVTDYRNPVIAEMLKNLGYVQRFGVGIQLARKELAVNGNPPPEFVVEDTHVLVIVRSRS